MRRGRKTSILVIRAHCLPEDEGRDCYICSFPTKKEAERWIADQKGQYFRPSDYYIAESLGDRK